MKTFLTFTIATLLAFSNSANAVPAESCGNKIDVSVNGLVCDFCARALEKVFSKEDSVERIHVDLDAALVQVFTKPEKSISNEKLTKLITDSGYNVADIKKGC